MSERKFDDPLAKCCLCKSIDIKFLKTDWTGITIYVCSNCKTEFMNPQYTDQYLNEFYSSYQNTDNNHHEYGNLERPREILHDFNISQIEQFTSKGRFLSVGCGNGLDIKVAASRGWAVEGYDVATDFVQKLSEKLGLKIFSGDFTKLTIPENQYQCIYLNHVLEHPKQPGEYLEKIAKLLKVGGALYIACPNIHSLSCRFKNILDRLGVKKKVANHYDTWQHLFYYDPVQLKGILEKYHGFNVVFYSDDITIAKNQTELKFKPKNGVANKSTFRMIALKK